MALRLDDELHAQLTVLAQLSGGSLTEIIRNAIDAYLEARRKDPTLAAQADSVLAEIDEAARTRRDAIANLFTKTDEATTNKAPQLASVGDEPTRRGSRKGTAS